MGCMLPIATTGHTRSSIFFVVNGQAFNLCIDYLLYENVMSLLAKKKKTTRKISSACLSDQIPVYLPSEFPTA